MILILMLGTTGHQSWDTWKNMIAIQSPLKVHGLSVSRQYDSCLVATWRSKVVNNQLQCTCCWGWRFEYCCGNTKPDGLEEIQSVEAHECFKTWRCRYFNKPRNARMKSNRGPSLWFTLQLKCTSTHTFNKVSLNNDQIWTYKNYKISIAFISLCKE